MSDPTGESRARQPSSLARQALWRSNVRCSAWRLPHHTRRPNVRGRGAWSTNSRCSSSSTRWTEDRNVRAEDGGEDSAAPEPFDASEVRARLDLYASGAVLAMVDQFNAALNKLGIHDRPKSGRRKPAMCARKAILALGALRAVDEPVRGPGAGYPRWSVLLVGASRPLVEGKRKRPSSRLLVGSRRPSELIDDEAPGARTLTRCASIAPRPDLQIDAAQ
jgi:hypothetical protein